VRDSDPSRNGPSPGAVGSSSSARPAPAADALAAVEPGGFVLLFAEPGAVRGDDLPARDHVTGSRSATPRHMEEAVALLPELDLRHRPRPPLDRFDEGLAAYRSREALKVVFRP
jgi:threonine dehydrogenase-like Zn-dependent dehydrogenase